MAITARTAILALKPLAQGACKAVGFDVGSAAIGAVTNFLGKRFTDESQNLTDALRKSHDRAWQAVELSLAGDSWWQRVQGKLTEADTRALRDQVLTFIRQTEPDARKREKIRKLAYAEFKDAKKRGLLAFQPPAPEELAAGTADYVRFTDPLSLARADHVAVDGISDDLRRAGYDNLAAWIQPEDGPPLVAVAARYFFRRAVEEDSQLSQGLTFAQLEQLQESQEQAFAGLNQAITEQGQRLEDLLGDIQTVVVETRETVLDIRMEQERLGKQNAEMYNAVMSLQQKLDLVRTNVRPRDSLSIRSDQERALVKQLVARYRALPEDQRSTAPALLNAVGQLQIAAGDFAGAQQNFQTVATMVTDNSAKGEAHMNAYRAALEKRDYSTSIRELVEAIKLDAKRFAPFPVGKYLPQRILGAGGFGVAFLCKHKYLNAPVVVKTLLGEEFDRSMDEVFSEAQAIQQLDHPAIIRLQDCGFVDAGKKSRPFIVMDYFEGTTLEEYVTKNGPLSVEELLGLVGPVAAGLQAAHAKNILHRDIKPANLLVRRVDEGVRGASAALWEVKLIDFGLALRPKTLQRGSSASKSLAGVSIAGTIDYAAPEQMGKLADTPVGKPADIFSFGKTCCFALFQTTNPLRKHWNSIPAPLADLLERCLAETPDERPIDFGVVARCFARLQGQSEPVTTVAAAVVAAPMTVPSAITRRPPPAQPPPRRPVRDDLPDYPQKKGMPIGLMLGIGGGVAALAVVGILMAVLFSGGSNDLKKPIEPGGPLVQGPNGQPQIGPGPKNNDPIDPPVRPKRGGTNPGDADAKLSTTVTFKDVPSREVATFIEDRLNGALEETRRDVFARTKNVHIRGKPIYSDQTLTVLIDSDNEIVESIRNLELGIVEASAGGLSVQVVAPPAPNRNPPTKIAGAKLLPGQTQLIKSAIRTGKEHRKALEQLAAVEPNPADQAEIRTMLLSLLQSTEHGIPDLALQALGTWGTEQDVNQMVLYCDSKAGAFGPNEHAIVAMGKLKSPKGADFLVRWLGNFFVGEKAYTACRSIGPKGEKAYQVALNDKEGRGRIFACQLLKEFGSTASIPALKTVIHDKDANVSKAAWDALKTIAFHPTKPVASEPDLPPVVDNKKTTTTTIDDLKVTTLDDGATAVQQAAIAADGKSYYTLGRDGVMTRYDWNAKQQARTNMGTGAVIAVSNNGVFMIGSGDGRLYDPLTLESQQSGPMPQAKSVSAGTGHSVAVARCEVPGQLLLLDLSSFTVRQAITDAKIASFGKSEPTVTADGKFVFTRGGGKLYRWRVDGGRMGFSESSDPLGSDAGHIVVSPDGRYVSLFYPDGNPSAAKVGTLVFAAGTLKKAEFTIEHGAKAADLIFDNKGGAWVSSADGTLTRFGPNGTKQKSYKLDGAARQMILSPDGEKLLVLTDMKLMRIDLPK